MANSVIVELPNGIIVERFQMIGCDWYVYKAFIKGANAFGKTIDGKEYCSITTIDGQNGWVADISTLRTPKEYLSLPAMSKEREEKVKEWHNSACETAYSCIFEAFPNLRNTNHKLEAGQISYYGTNPV